MKIAWLTPIYIHNLFFHYKFMENWCYLWIREKMMSMTKTRCKFVCNWCQPHGTMASGIMAITYALLSLQLGKRKKVHCPSTLPMWVKHLDSHASCSSHLKQISVTKESIDQLMVVLILRGNGMGVTEYSTIICQLSPERSVKQHGRSGGQTKTSSM